ncbi:MAG: HAD family hydrolase [Clostridia bacterium]|nr:HAD family hydrolase [Clostridia bacterium]
MIFDGIVLLSDIDGTLSTYERKIPQENIDAIEYFTKNGGRFGVATGRTAYSAGKMIRNLAVNCPCIAVNGGAIYDYQTQQLLFAAYLDHRATKLFTPVIDAVPGIGIEINVDGVLHCIKYSDRSREHIMYERGEFTQYALQDIPTNANWFKALFAATPKEIDKVEQLCNQIIGEDDPFYVIRTEPTLFEILPKDATKGEGVRRLSKLLSIPIENIYAIGDYYNDIDFLQAAGYSAAVSGAPKEVIAVTDTTVCSCNDGAIADFIRLIEQKIKTSK